MNYHSHLSGSVIHFYITTFFIIYWRIRNWFHHFHTNNLEVHQLARDSPMSTSPTYHFPTDLLKFSNFSRVLILKDNRWILQLFTSPNLSIYLEVSNFSLINQTTDHSTSPIPEFLTYYLPTNLIGDFWSISHREWSRIITPWFHIISSSNFITFPLSLYLFH